MRKLVLLVPLCCCVAVSAQQPGDTIVDEAKRLYGVWKGVSLVRNGDNGIKEKEDVAKLRVIIKADSCIFQWNDTKKVPFSFKVDARVNPKQIDMTALEGFCKGRLCPGIYKVEGDTLTICVNSAAQKDRPAAFQSALLSNHSLYVLKRDKP